MKEEVVLIHFDRESAAYQPREELSGRFVWHSDDSTVAEAEAVELSVVWYTEGKGDEDLGVHHFRRMVPGEETPPLPGREHRFHVRLPRSPLSYEGLVVGVCWAVRVRVFLKGGRNILGEGAFRVGNVARAQEVPA